ncbi:MAG: fumarylacetoacetate hydrolase family protein [Chloroflexi bacterium]|nr:fumarylacetoacetate hydrolase family protein [Chloroflexota bacterium]
MFQDEFVIELTNIRPNMSMLEFIEAGPRLWEESEQLAQSNGGGDKPKRWIKEAVSIHPALSNPPSLRDFYAFEQHVATSNANRGREIPKAWYEIPVFYFSNPNAIFGHEQEVPIPKSTQEMDFELEVAAIIGKPGRDIPADKAMQHIFGFTIFNDWSARDVQRQEMSVGLGPAKGKDFASSLGPFIVTPDELEDKSDGRPGVYELEMIARINGNECSRGNWKDIHYSFGDMIARASADVLLSSGDVIGSGTVGTGTLLEITKAKGPWLQRGDVVEFEIERLGILRNRVV